MKVAQRIAGAALALTISSTPGLEAKEKKGSFSDFLNRDRRAMEDYQNGKPREKEPVVEAPAQSLPVPKAPATEGPVPEAPAPEPPLVPEDPIPEAPVVGTPAPVSHLVETVEPEPTPTVSPKRRRASELYDEYCRIGDILDNPDPQRGYNKRISDLRTKLFPTDRGWYDQTYWSQNDWDVKWPFLQDLEARAAKHRAAMEKLAATWKAEGFESIFHRSLDDCYGRKIAYSYLDRDDQSVFPSPIRTKMIDYVYYQMDQLWPTNRPVPASPPTDDTDSTVVHKTPPPPEPEPPETEEIDEEIQEENIAEVKPWDQMTPEERRRALMENSPEAWAGFRRDIFGSDTNAHARAKAAVTVSNVTAVTTNIAIANLPPPAAVPIVRSWDQMTTEERHEALKGNRCEAWDAVRDALLSGDRAQTDAVLAALSSKPAINDTARAMAYWHGYQQGQMESATHAEQSTIEAVVSAYKIPELMALVREGYSDGKAGRPQKYGLPNPAELQNLMPSHP